MNNKREIQIAQPTTGEEEWQAVKDSIISGWLTQGPKVRQFEKSFSEKYKIKHTLAVSSCTSGLHLALAAMGVGPGDEVIVPAFTWVSSANAVLYCGATPVFVDVSIDNFNIDINQIAKKITDKTKAIIPVHLFGLCVDIDLIKSIIPNNIKILEDAACAAGAIYKDKYAGTLGDISSFSFHPRKSITTGEGGMVATQNSYYYELMDQMRNHGATVSEEERHNGSKPYILPDFNLLGFNYRMTDLQGSIGMVQLEKLKSLIKERSKWAKWYNEKLSDIKWLKLPQEPNNGKHGWQSYVTYVEPNLSPFPRNQVMEKLKEMGISSRPGTHAVHMLSFYQNRFGIKPSDYPGAKACYENSMAIPLHNQMVKEDYEYIVSALRNI